MMTDNGDRTNSHCVVVVALGECAAGMDVRRKGCLIFIVFEVFYRREGGCHLEFWSQSGC